MFNKMAEICVAMIVDDLLFLCFYCNIYEMKPDIFEIFRTFSRYLEITFEIFRKKNREFPEIYVGDFS